MWCLPEGSGGWPPRRRPASGFSRRGLLRVAWGRGGRWFALGEEVGGGFDVLAHGEAGDEGVEECAGGCGVSDGLLDGLALCDEVDERGRVEVAGLLGGVVSGLVGGFEERGVSAAGGDDHEVAEAAGEGGEELFGVGAACDEFVGGFECGAWVVARDGVDELGDECGGRRAEDEFEDDWEASVEAGAAEAA